MLERTYGKRGRVYTALPDACAPQTVRSNAPLRIVKQSCKEGETDPVPKPDWWPAVPVRAGGVDYGRNPIETI